MSDQQQRKFESQPPNEHGMPMHHPPTGYSLESLWQEHYALIQAHNAGEELIAHFQRQIAFLREVNQGLIAGIQDGAAMYQALQAERDHLQRRVDHLLISLQIFGNLTVVYGEEKEGKATVVCPDCMHAHKLTGTLAVGARHAYTCPKCKAQINMICGFDGDQIIEVSERVPLAEDLEGRKAMEQDNLNEYAQQLETQDTLDRTMEGG